MLYLSAIACNVHPCLWQLLMHSCITLTFDIILVLMFDLVKDKHILQICKTLLKKNKKGVAVETPLFASYSRTKDKTNMRDTRLELLI